MEDNNGRDDNPMRRVAKKGISDGHGEKHGRDEGHYDQRKIGLESPTQREKSR